MYARDHVSRRYDKSSLSSTVTSAVRIEVHHQIVLINERGLKLVSQAQRQREPVVNFVIVSREVTVFPVGNVQRGTHVTNVSDTGGRQSQQEVRETADIVGVVNCSTRIVSVERETVDGLVANYVASGSNRMVADGPTDRVAERGEFLIHRTVSVTTAVGNSGEPTKDKRDLSGSVHQWRTDNTSIGSDFSIRESDTRKKLASRHVRTAIQQLVIDTASQLIHKSVGKDPCVRQRHRVICLVL